MRLFFRYELFFFLLIHLRFSSFRTRWRSGGAGRGLEAARIWGGNWERNGRERVGSGRKRAGGGGIIDGKWGNNEREVGDNRAGS